MQTRPWVVTKFGGTSVANGHKWQHIVDIVQAHVDAGLRVVMVCSAPATVSDLLEQLLSAAVENHYQPVIEQIEQLYQDLAQQLALNYGDLLQGAMQQLSQLIMGISLIGEVSARTRAKVMSMGEFMLTRLGAAYLSAQGISVGWQDASQLLRSVRLLPLHQQHRYLAERCSDQANPQLQQQLNALQHDVMITQGFIAGNQQNEIVLLGRGGSDTSAAYFAAQLQAQFCEIWTDVLGIYTTNPHQIVQTRLLKQLNYDEAQEIASMGARVLHPNCIDPLRAHCIPLHIKQTDHPKQQGSVISLDGEQSGLPIKCIIQRSNILLITIETVYMWKRVGFAADVFQCFKQHGLSVDFISTSESNITVSLDNNIYQHNQVFLQAALDDLNTFAQASIIGPCASISLIGNHIRKVVPTLGEAFEVFETQQIHLLSQAANDLNLTFVVDEDQVERLCKKLHWLLIEQHPKNYLLGPSWQQQVGALEPLPIAWWQQQADPLIKLAQQQSPLYVYDRTVVRDAISQLESCDVVSQFFYAMKANANSAILTEIYQSTVGFECVSMAEVNRVLQLFPDIDKKRILFTPNFAAKVEYQQALALGLYVTLDNLYLLSNWGELFSGQPVLLRIDPGYGCGHHKYVHTGGNDSKFGIPLTYLDVVKELVAQHNIQVIGLHTHSGSGILQADNWYNTALQLTELIAHFPQVKIINLGGGLGIAERAGQTPLVISQLNESLQKIKAAYPQLSIWMEPGRFLVARAGVLLAKVTQTKVKGETKFIGIDAGMNSLIRPALYGAYHEIVNLSRLDQPNVDVVNVVGPICESGDTLGYSRMFPETFEGDVILIANTGAYGYCMSSHYNLREPAEETCLDERNR